MFLAQKLIKKKWRCFDMDHYLHDLIVVGGGIAGLTASIYASCSGLDVLCIENQACGGQIINTPKIINYPGFLEIDGMGLVENIQKQCANLGINIQFQQIFSMDLAGSTKIFKINSGEHRAKAAIIATGATPKKLEVKGEKALQGRGVSYCATCDGRFFEGKIVAVVGGGRTAISDAIYLSNICKQVYVIHRRREFRASKAEVENMTRRKNISLKLNKIVSEINGNGVVEGVELKDVQTDEKHELKLDGVFVAIGSIPNSENFKKWVDRDAQGYIISDEDCKTKTDGLFVAGDVRSKKVRQLVTAASDGAISALAAAEYIQNTD